MDTGEHLSELFRYNEWANRRVADSLRKNDCKRALEIFGHLLTTEQEYFERLTGKDSTGFDFWPDLAIEECAALAETNARAFEKRLNEATEADLDLKASYKNSRGQPFEDTLRDLMTHVLIHSSIHRGNIIIKLRESGVKPPEIDHIVYIRENKQA